MIDSRILLVFSLVTLAMVLTGLKKENTALTVSGQCLAAVGLFLILSNLGA
jgi:hypothetical protein